MLPTNEQVGLWLDPERKREGWWDTCVHCDLTQTPMLSERIIFTGPDFTQPGPCAEFVEPALEELDCGWMRNFNKEQICWTTQLWKLNKFCRKTPLSENPNHQHACLLAMAEVMKNG